MIQIEIDKKLEEKLARLNAITQEMFRVEGEIRLLREMSAESKTADKGKEGK